MLENLITSKTRLRILIKFFINVANNGHLRGLAEKLQESTNAIRKELNNLPEGYLDKANIRHPLFSILQTIIHQYLGLDSLVATILKNDFVDGKL